MNNPWMSKDVENAFTAMEKRLDALETTVKELEAALKAKLATMVCGTCRGERRVQSEHWLPTGLCELISIPCPTCQPKGCDDDKT